MRYRIFVNGIQRNLTEEERAKMTNKLITNLGYEKVKKEVISNERMGNNRAGTVNADRLT